MLVGSVPASSRLVSPGLEPSPETSSLFVPAPGRTQHDANRSFRRGSGSLRVSTGLNETCRRRRWTAAAGAGRGETKAARARSGGRAQGAAEPASERSRAYVSEAAQAATPRSGVMTEREKHEAAPEGAASMLSR